MSQSYFTNYAFVDPSLPDTWGSQSWTFLHAVAAGYPLEPTDEDRERYRNFFENLQYILPCNDCRNHFARILSKRPVTDAVLINRVTLSRWTMEVHNVVSQDLNKSKQFNWREYCKRYKGVDDNAIMPQRNAERITRKARLLSRTNAVPRPDNSLGTVGNTPARWSSATKGWNDTAIKSLERKSAAPSVYVPAPARTGAPRKKCGCKK